MQERTVHLTREGLAKAKAELDELRGRRHEIADRMHTAKEAGLTQMDAEYEDAKNEQALLEGRIAELENLVRRHVLIDEKTAHASSSVRIGSTVTVDANSASRQYTIVGVAEADPTSGRVSNESPVGKALIGRRVGERVQVITPKGVMSMTVKEIK